MCGGQGVPKSSPSGPVLFLIAENRPVAVPQGCGAQACQGLENDFRGGKRERVPRTVRYRAVISYGKSGDASEFIQSSPLPPLLLSFPSRKGAVNLSNLGILVSAFPLKHDRWPIFQAKSHPLQAAVRKPQKVLEGAQEMAGSNLEKKMN